jgi:hypothetical protein
VAYIFPVNQCEPVVVHAHTIRVFDPLTLKDGYLQSRVVIEFPYILYVPIVRGYLSHPVSKAKPEAHRMYAQDQVVIHTVRM